MRSDAAPEAAFAAGNFTAHALEGVPDRWETIAARGLILDPVAAAAALAGFDGADATFYRAACHWIGGDEDAAARLLERHADPRALNLLSLIRQPKLEVLAQLPIAGNGTSPLLDGIAADAKFRVRPVLRDEDEGSEGDLLRRLFDPARPPSFFLAAMVETAALPLGLGDLPCPTIGCSRALDAHLATLVPWLRAFDHVIVGDHLRQAKSVAAITGGAVVAYPLLPGLPQDAPPPAEGAREIDVFMAGALFSAHDPRLARLVQHVLHGTDLKLLLIDGAPDRASYFGALAQSRVTACFSPLPGVIIDQAFDALAMGSIALVPQGSAHALWGGEAEGVFTFDAETGPLPQIARILADYPRYAAGCLANAKRLRGAWDAKAVASRLFRFAALLAASPRPARDPARHRSLWHRRSGFVETRGDYFAARATAERRVARLTQLDAEAPAAHWHNAAARELLLAYGEEALRQYDAPYERRPLTRALEILGRAVDGYPDNLVLHVNLMRALYVFGDDGQRAEGIGLAAEIVERPPDQWRVDILDDVYPASFNRNFLNTGEFQRLQTRHAAGDEDAGIRLRDLLLAAVFHVLARHWGRTDFARRAVALDADFAPYRLTLAERLLDHPAAPDLEQARSLLVALAQESNLAGPALFLLRHLAERGAFEPAELARLAAAYQQAQRSLLLAPEGREIASSYFARSLRLKRGGGRDAAIHRRALHRKQPLLSLILYERAELGCRETLSAIDAIRTRSSVPGDYQVILVRCSGELPPETARGADLVLDCRHDDFLDFPLAALNAALDQAEAAVAVVLDIGFLPSAELLDAMIAAFFGARSAAPGVPLVAERRLIVGGDGDSGGPAVIAFRPQDAYALGFFDEAPFFAGDRGLPHELAWRLHRAGIPTSELKTTLAPRSLALWWRLAPFADRPSLIEWAQKLEPQLLDGERTAALARAPHATPFVPIAIARRMSGASPRLRDAAGSIGPGGGPPRGVRWFFFCLFSALADGSETAARGLAAGRGAVATFVTLGASMGRPVVGRLSAASRRALAALRQSRRR